MIEGKLIYRGWLGSWDVETLTGTVDIRTIIIKTFVEANASKETFLVGIGPEKFVLLKSPESTATITYHGDYVDDGGGFPNVIIEEESRFSNLSAYLRMITHKLNGRTIRFESTEHGFKIVADPNVDVHRVPMVPGSNEGAISDEALKTVCRAGQGADCCIFITCSADGFRCQKFGDMAENILSRTHMNAKRIGDCKPTREAT